MTPLVTCRRPGCNRRLTSKASVARGIGRQCERLERAERKREALETVLRIATAPYSGRQKDDANALIAAGKLQPLSRPGLWQATGSDDVTEYITTALSCTCPSRVPCKHMCAVTMREAYEAVA